MLSRQLQRQGDTHCSTWSQFGTRCTRPVWWSTRSQLAWREGATEIHGSWRRTDEALSEEMRNDKEHSSLASLMRVQRTIDNEWHKNPNTISLRPPNYQPTVARHLQTAHNYNKRPSFPPAAYISYRARLYRAYGRGQQFRESVEL